MKRKALSVSVFAVCVLFSIGGLINVFGDTEYVRTLAEQTACPKPNCTLTATSMEKTTFRQTFIFSGEPKLIRVTCARSLVVFGDYTCKLDEQ